jgi:hypothetical protein
MTKLSWRPLIALAAAGAIALGAAVGGGVLALWRDSAAGPAITLTVGQVSAKVTRTGSASTASEATSEAGATLTFSKDDAVQVAKEVNGLAIPFDVSLGADGNAGMNYSFTLPAATADSVAEKSVFWLFQPSGSCSAGAVPEGVYEARPGQTVGPFVGVAADRLKLNQSATWCLVVKLDPELLGSYEIDAEAEVTQSGKTVTATDSWHAVIIPPSPETNAPYQVALNTLFTRPDTPAPPAPGVTSQP